MAGDLAGQCGWFVAEAVDTGRAKRPLRTVGGIGAGIGAQALGEDKANPALAGVICGLARDNAALLETSRPFARGIKDGRLALEVDLIQTLADDLNSLLMNRDPLSEAVHHSKMDVAALFMKRLPAFVLMRLMRPKKT